MSELDLRDLDLDLDLDLDFRPKIMKTVITNPSNMLQDCPLILPRWDDC